MGALPVEGREEVKRTNEIKMVDPLMAHTVGDLILKLKRQRGITAVVVTHDVKLARKLADRVVFLAEGRVGFFGPMTELGRCPDPLIKEFVQLDELPLLK